MPVLKTLLGRNDPFIRSSTLGVLAAIGAAARDAGAEILATLRDPDNEVRSAAILAIDALNLDLGGSITLFTPLVVNRFLRSDTREYFDELADELRPSGLASARGQYNGLPGFPWPPPRWTHIAAFGRDFPRNLLGDDATTLRQVHAKLFQALKKADGDFESSVFGIPNGFVVLAKMERTQEDGGRCLGNIAGRETRSPP